MVRADGLTAEPVGYPADANAIVALGSDEPRLAEYGVVLVRLTGAEPAKIVFPADWQANFQRHQDLLLLQFRFNHIRLTAQGSAVPWLGCAAANGQKATVSVYFQTQSIAEGSTRETDRRPNRPADFASPFNLCCTKPPCMAVDRMIALSTPAYCWGGSPAMVAEPMSANLRANLSAAAISYSGLHRLPAIKQPAA